MKVFNVVIACVRIIFDILILILKCIILLPAAFVLKSKAIDCFKREMDVYGLPPEAARELAQSYKDMVSLNMFFYARHGMDLRKSG